MKENNQTVAGAGATTANAVSEVKEVKPPMNIDIDKFLADTEKAIKTDGNYKEKLPEDPKERARFFLKKAEESIIKSITYNKKIEWTEGEIKVFNQIKAITVVLVQKIDELVENIPLQEKGLARIEQQLAEKPITDIKVQPASGGNFSIVKISTGEVITTGSVEMVKGVLNGLYIAQQV